MVDKNPYKGTISSVILSLFVLFLLLVPILTANAIERVRKGDGKYDFQDTLCYDINSEDDFNNEPGDIGQDYGEGALGYWFETDGGGLILSEMAIMDYPFNGTMDNYGVGITGSIYSPPVEFSIIMILLTMTKDDIIDKDITRVDIFLNITGIDDDCEFEVWLAPIEEEPDYKLGEITAGELSKIKIDVSDILEINTFPEDEELVLWFVPEEEECVTQPESTVVFDMQFYCIEEIKIPSLTKIGIWMLGIACFMIFCSYLMLPQVTFEGIINNLKKSLERYTR